MSGGEDRLLATFLDLVRIDSPSGSEATLAGHVESALTAAGLDVVRDDSSDATGSDTGNIVASLPANRQGRSLILSAHLDCVQPCEGVRPVVEGGWVRSSGETVLGADDKAGIAAIIELLRRIAEEDLPHAGIRLVLTVAEERGLVGAKALDPGELLGDLCLVLDADGPPGGVVVGSPTHYTFVATFRGRASHAGVQPEEGLSAISMAADAVREMPQGRLDDETTANIGTVSGGTATNVVPAEAVLTGECRSLDRRRVEEVRERMDVAMRQAAEAVGGGVEVCWTKEYEGVSVAEDDPDLLAVIDAIESAGLEARTYATGGGSDGNIFAAAGVKTLVLSCGMQGVHGTDERVAVDDLHALVRILEAVVAGSVR